VPRFHLLRCSESRDFPHADLAHVAERHRLDLVLDAAGRQRRRLAQAAAGRGPGEVLKPRPAQGPGWAPCGPTDSVSPGAGGSRTVADRFGVHAWKRSRLRAGPGDGLAATFAASPALPRARGPACSVSSATPRQASLGGSTNEVGSRAPLSRDPRRAAPAAAQCWWRSAAPIFTNLCRGGKSYHLPCAGSSLAGGRGGRVLGSTLSVNAQIMAIGQRPRIAATAMARRFRWRRLNAMMIGRKSVTRPMIAPTMVQMMMGLSMVAATTPRPAHGS
jgi:hypothetical protein